ncbi:MAG TPA: hypothetical protein VKV33_05155, partial [Streptosporangiaceae bacterium]|nr:hypothetical protein [Streptosporangiaceae bacterium]
MSEKADESRGSRDALLDQAAQAALAAGAAGAEGAAGGDGTGGVLGAVGDVATYLRAYYFRVATEDLASFGPGPMAAVAANHAALAGQRPQGRPLVRVLDASGGGGSAGSAEAAGTVGPGGTAATAGAGGRPPGPAVAMAAFGPVRAVVDIVTDDMPFLVDSVT